MRKFSRRLIFLLFPLFFLPITTAAYAQEPSEPADTNQSVVLTVSEESIASLSRQLSAEQFSVLEEKVLGQIFSQLDLSALEIKKKKSKKSRKKEEAQNAAVFTEEEVVKIQKSLALYFNVLARIQQVVPLLKASNERKQKIKKLESNFDSLMKEEKESTQKEIIEIKAELAVYSDKFKAVSEQFDFESINFDKLPGMLDNLGYEDSFYDVVYAELSEYIGLIRKVDTASSIIQSLAEVSGSAKKAEENLRKAKTVEERKTLSEQITKLAARKKSLENDFTLTATGIDPSALDEKTTKKLNVEEEMTKVFSPLIVGLTEFTEPSRRIEFLRSNIAYYDQNVPKIRHGVEQIDQLLAETQDKKVKAKLREERKYWEQQEKEFSAKLEVAKQQLIEVQNRKLSPVDAFEHFTQAIFSKRGLNIIFSVLIFFLTIIALLLLRRLIFLINPFSYIPKLRFIASLIDVVLYFLTFVIATLAMVVSLYVAGEILVLAIVVAIILGMVWAVRNTLPAFAEQIKLLLGYGPVRQGERVMHEQIPWLVESIGIYSYLKNPLLTGGRVRLPIKDLIAMRSRPYDEKETWFPCEEGDCVLINHKEWRQVIVQTPQRIKFNWYDMEETMPTSQFLKQKIFNLSKTPFWAGVNLYIAYEHREKVMEEIVGQLGDFVGEEFKKLPFGDALLYPWVDFSGMTDTSLGVMVWVQVKPEAALKYNGIKLNLTKICLKAANHYGWEIIRFHSIQQRQPEALLGDPLLETDMDI